MKLLLIKVVLTTKVMQELFLHARARRKIIPHGPLPDEVKITGVQEDNQLIILKDLVTVLRAGEARLRKNNILCFSEESPRAIEQKVLAVDRTHLPKMFAEEKGNVVDQ